MTFLVETMKLGLTNLRLHLLRSILTALGIILGVAAVITMVALGEGTKQEALMQIERLGARNIIVRSQRPPESNQSGGQERSFLLRFGLTRDDLTVIEANFPEAEAIVPLKEVGSEILRQERRQVSQAYGTTPDLPDVTGIRVARGRYLTSRDLEEQAKVAVIAKEVQKEMFPFDDPLGQVIHIDETAFTIVGVLEPVGLSGGAGASLVGRDLNLDVHVPITTVRAIFNDTVVRRTSGSFQGQEVQVSEILMMAPSRERVLTDAARLRRILDVRHPEMTDVTMIVPFELLEQAKKTAMTWKIVLAAIASISLLVGGIGIMNIMLATVTERTREIGIRRALGATRYHIVSQFLVETGVLSAVGGLIGVALGVSTSFALEALVPVLHRIPLIGSFFDAEGAAATQVTLWSILLAFGVATLTGLVFGIYPALQAARQDPIVALRHD